MRAHFRKLNIFLFYFFFIQNFLSPLPCGNYSELQLKREVVSISNELHVYFINMDKSVDRQERLKRDIAFLPRHLSETIHLHRVSAVTTSDVKAMLANETFVLNGVDRLIEPGNSYDWWDKKYTAQEVAVLLSHIKAVQMAYDDGHETAMIVEDDIDLSIDFLENWKAYADMAPIDWTVLQWVTSNTIVNKKEAHLSNDFWLSWYTFHWGAIVYSIRRDGMRRILRRTSNFFTRNRTDSMVWRIEEPNMLTSDEVIFYLAGNTYTSSHCWVNTKKVASTFGDEHETWLEFGQSMHVPTKQYLQNIEIERPESIAIVESMRMKSADEIREAFHSINADIHSVARFNPRSKWFLKVVLTCSDLLPAFRRAALQLPLNHTHLEVEVTNNRFNKFVFIREKIDEFVHFDFILLKDNDIRLAGFEWNTFLNKKSDSVVSGPFFMNMKSVTTPHLTSAYEYKLKPWAHIQFQDGGNFNSYEDEGFQIVDSTPVMALEMLLVLMKSEFAVWFFRQILTDEYHSYLNERAAELMWCGAAHEYQSKLMANGSLVPCNLISVNARNMKSFKHMEGEVLLAHITDGDLARENVGRMNARFKDWMKAAQNPLYNYRLFFDWCAGHPKSWQQGKRLGECLGDFLLKDMASV